MVGYSVPADTPGERKMQGRRHVLDGVEAKAVETVDARRGNEPPPPRNDLR